MSNLLRIRPITNTDYEGWLPLWDGYNAFYGRQGDTALGSVVPSDDLFDTINEATVGTAAT